MPTTREEFRQFLTGQLGRIPRLLMGRELKAVIEVTLELLAERDDVVDDLLTRLKGR